MNEIIYGPGGFDPSHPNGNIVEQVADNGDGTGTRTTYDDKGTVVETETITGLPIPEVDDTPADPAAVLSPQDGNADLTQYEDPGVKTVSEYNGFATGWKLVLRPPSATAPQYRVLIASSSNVAALGLEPVDYNLDPIPYMMDTATTALLSTASTLLLTFEPAQVYGGTWTYLVTGTPFDNLD